MSACLLSICYCHVYEMNHGESPYVAMPEKAILSRPIVKYLSPNMVSGNTYIKDKTSQENGVV